MNIKKLLTLSLLVAFSASARQKTLVRLTQGNPEQILSQMTLEEKVNLVIGVRGAKSEARGDVGRTESDIAGAAGKTAEVERLGIPHITLADGPAGLRIDPLRKGVDDTFYCTGFPIGTLMAASWNEKGVERLCSLMGDEVKEYGVDVLLAPGLNIHRNPLCGRNFEYYSEDPVLSGRTAGAFIRGVQSAGVGTSAKHFAVNNQEINRLALDARVDLKTLREIYLRNFRIALREGKPWTVMTSYNYLNGRYTSQDRELLETLLREEWGFQGVVMTDWGAGVDVVEQVGSGNDLIMPGSDGEYRRVIEAARTGKLSMEALDRSCLRILRLIVKTPAFHSYRYSSKPDLEAHARAVADFAAEGFVLLKNEDKTLPLGAGRKVSLMGVGSYSFITGGKGSGDVHCPYKTQLPQAMREAGLDVNGEVEAQYLKHVAKEREVYLEKMQKGRGWWLYECREREIQGPWEMVENSAKESDVAVITISRGSSEGFDRHVERDYMLSTAELDLIHSAHEVYHARGGRVVVVLNVCGPVDVTAWQKWADAVLVCWNPGQTGALAVARCLEGSVSPSGRLPMSFPLGYDRDNISTYDTFARNVPETGKNQSFEHYSRTRKFYALENIDYCNYVEKDRFGYRDPVKKAYDFGFGLSYSTFSVKDVSAREQGDQISVHCSVTNTGERSSKNVVQVYVKNAEGVFVLAAFAKSRTLGVAESEQIAISFPKEDIASYCQSTHQWSLPERRLEIRVTDGVNILDTELQLSQPWSEKTHDILQPAGGAPLYICASEGRP